MDKQPNPPLSILELKCTQCVFKGKEKTLGCVKSLRSANPFPWFTWCEAYGRPDKSMLRSWHHPVPRYPPAGGRPQGKVADYGWLSRPQRRLGLKLVHQRTHLLPGRYHLKFMRWSACEFQVRHVGRPPKGPCSTQSDTSMYCRNWRALLIPRPLTVCRSHSQRAWAMGLQIRFPGAHPVGRSLALSLKALGEADWVSVKWIWGANFRAVYSEGPGRASSR